MAASSSQVVGGALLSSDAFPPTSEHFFHECFPGVHKLVVHRYLHRRNVSYKFLLIRLLPLRATPLSSLLKTCNFDAISLFCRWGFHEGVPPQCRFSADRLMHVTPRFEATAYTYAIDEGEGDGDSTAVPDVANDVSVDDSKNTRGLVEAWLEDAFVGHLREDALLFVWDHLFLLG